MKARNNSQKRQTPGPGGPAPLEEQALVARVAAFLAERNKHGRQSLRALAAEIKVSKSTIDALVQAHNGHREMPAPHVTWPRLRSWYLREKAAAGGLREGAVDMAMVAREVLADFPEARLGSATAELCGLVGDLHDRYGVARPAWLRRLTDPGAAEPPSPLPLPPK